MKKLRLLTTKRCDRACPGCCNKDWDLDALPIATTYEGYDKIILTGGEPMLYPERLMSIIMDVKMENPSALIYMYTAKMDDPGALVRILQYINGLVCTIHDYQDGVNFVAFDWGIRCWSGYDLYDKSLRLNIFKDSNFKLEYINGWKVKFNMEWIKDCPLPKDEVFMRWSDE